MLGAVEHLQRATRANGEVDREPTSPRHCYLDQLKRDLGIVAGQGEAWGGFAAALRANARRMSATADADLTTASDVYDLAFGELQDRLAALAAMQQAAGELLATLTPVQGGRAARVLPLCCLPTAGRLNS